MQIIAALRGRQSASIGELHRLFSDITVKTIQRDLQALVNKGLLKAEGEKRGRRYVLAR
ncbi:MAG: DeoR family transcriptional regulator [Candidatus Saccharicenans sp.]